MNRNTLLAPSLLLLALCASASAAGSPALKRCLDSATSTAAMVGCNAKEAKVQDTRLNKAYKLATSRLDGQRKQQLQDVQRLWIKYRDANCGFVGAATGGTIDQVNGSACLLEMTRTRAQELENLVGP